MQDASRNLSESAARPPAEGATAAVQPAAAQPALETLRLRDWSDRPSLESAWQDLLERADHCSVFQTYEWNRCWWRVFGAQHELLLVLARDHHRVVGIAPMMVCRRGRARSRRRHAEIHFIGSTNDASDYCDFVIDPCYPQALEAMLDEICRSAGSVNSIDLSHVPDRSPFARRTAAYLDSRGLRAEVQVQNVAPVRVLGDPRADRAVANKSSVRRRTRHFERAGDLEFCRCATAAQMLERLDDFFAQHVARRALTSWPSQFLDSAQRRFYREVVRCFAPKGWLRFDVVLFNGVPLAFHLGFEYRKRFIWYKPAFDIRFAKRSPGQVLIRHLLNDAIDRRLEEFDFTIGAEPFKYRFANETRRILRIVAYTSMTAYWRHRLKRGGKRLLRPVLGPVLRPVRRWCRPPRA